MVPEIKPYTPKAKPAVPAAIGENIAAEDIAAEDITSAPKTTAPKGLLAIFTVAFSNFF